MGIDSVVGAEEAGEIRGIEGRQLLMELSPRTSTRGAGRWGRWKLLILRELLEGVRRFSDLQRELDADGVVERTVYPEVPPRVEYALTELEGLHAWGEKQQSEG